MKRFFLPVLALAFFQLQLTGQTFELSDIEVKNLGESSSAWGDYDNDGDLDFVIFGTDNTEAHTILYRNDDGNFVDAGAGLPGLEKGDVDWVDYDLDGDLDLMLLGRAADGNVTDIFVNNEGVFSKAGLGLQTVIEGCAAWADYDLDGDIDVLVSGDKSSYNPFTMLYRNDDGQFVETQYALEIAKNSIAAWGDYDNDGDEDLFLAGNGNIMFAKIYRNDISGFTDMEFEMKAQFAGGADWGDYDNDGDLDLLVNGFNEFLEAETVLYGNASGNEMKEIPAYLDKSATGNAEWGDYDNDGDLDMVFTGKGAGCGLIFSKVVRNDDGVYFNDAWAELKPLQRSHASWGDYDNDGDLDILLSGMDDSGYTPFSGVYTNLANEARRAGEVPAGLLATPQNGSVLLQWESGGQQQLTWNLRVGTSPGAADVVNPLADVETGFKRRATKGNVSNDTAWMLYGLQAGTYYWSVQSVDHTFAGSGFADEQSFDISITGVAEIPNNILRVFPNPANDLLSIELKGSYQIDLYDISGRLVLQTRASGYTALPVDQYPKGLYLLKIDYKGMTSTRKVTIE